MHAYVRDDMGDSCVPLFCLLDPEAGQLSQGPKQDHLSDVYMVWPTSY